MDLSSEILDTLDIVGNKDVLEVLKDGISEEDIILESEGIEDNEETEIEEIIEIIEEVEENDEISSSNDDTCSSKDKEKIKDETDEIGINIDNEIAERNIEVYGFDEENSMFTPQSTEETVKNMNDSIQKSSNKKQVINYDVDEDWQDEELERMEELEDTEMQTQATPKNDKHVNNQTALIPLQSNRLDLKMHVDSMGRADKSRTDGSIGNNVNMEDNGETTHEIVKNVENNLLYTVLGTKKQDSSIKQVDKFIDAHYVKVSIFSKNSK